MTRMEEDPNAWSEGYRLQEIASRVDAALRNSTPHRTGLADFPHPALQTDSHSSSVNPTVALQYPGLG